METKFLDVFLFMVFSLRVRFDDSIADENVLPLVPAVNSETSEAPLLFDVGTHVFSHVHVKFLFNVHSLYRAFFW